MKNILVTGGAGFIGTNYVHYLMKDRPNYRVTVIDALTYAGNMNNLASLQSRPNFSFIHGNICDKNLLSQVFSQKEIDTVVHFAAESHVDRSILGPDAFIDTNIVGTHTLLKVARESWGKGGNFTDKLFHHVSTDEVYGSLGDDDPAFEETTAYAPNSPYAASKAASDHLVRSYHHTFGLPVTTSNCSNNYGPYQFPEKLIPLCLLNILSGLPLPIYGDGKQIRDWLFVDDHNRGIQMIIENGTRGETYNIGGNNERTNLETVNMLCDVVDAMFNEEVALKSRFPNCPASKRDRSSSLIKFVDDRPGHDTRYAINAVKISKALGFAPKVGFETGLKETVSWYLENERWWQDIQSGNYREAI